MLNKLWESTKFWIVAARGFALPQTIMPYLLAVLMCYKTYELNWIFALMGLVGVSLAHLSANLLDDYFDWKTGVVEKRKKLEDEGVYAISYKCYYLLNGSVTEKHLLKIALTFAFIALLLGLIIAYNVGLPIIIIVLITGLLCVFYAAPPFKLSLIGLGEFTVGIIFGPLLMIGAYLASGGKIDLPIIYISLIVGIFVFGIVHIHCLLDFDSDIKAGIKSLSVRLGSVRNSNMFLGLSLGIAYAILILGVLTGVFPKLTLISLITFPKVIMLLGIMEKDMSEKKFWMGYIEKWDEYVKNDMARFIVRWGTLRNILTEFIIIFGLTYYFG